MICQFCKQDVDKPCRNAEQMRERAMSHVQHCEKALKDNQGLGSGAHARDVHSGGRHSRVYARGGSGSRQEYATTTAIRAHSTPVE